MLKKKRIPRENKSGLDLDLATHRCFKCESFSTSNHFEYSYNLSLYFCSIQLRVVHDKWKYNLSEDINNRPILYLVSIMLYSVSFFIKIACRPECISTISFFFHWWSVIFCVLLTLTVESVLKKPSENFFKNTSVVRSNITGGFISSKVS